MIVSGGVRTEKRLNTGAATRDTSRDASCRSPGCFTFELFLL